MGNKKSTIAVDNAKLESVFGRCGFGSCRSSCCEEQEKENDRFPNDPSEVDPQHKKIAIATRVELALVHKMVSDEMIASLKTDPEIPRLDVTRETDEMGTRITITIRPKK